MQCEVYSTGVLVKSLQKIIALLQSVYKCILKNSNDRNYFYNASVISYTLDTSQHCRYNALLHNPKLI